MRGVLFLSFISFVSTTFFCCCLSMIFNHIIAEIIFIWNFNFFFVILSLNYRISDKKQYHKIAIQIVSYRFENQSDRVICETQKLILDITKKFKSPFNLVLNEIKKNQFFFLVTKKSVFFSLWTSVSFIFFSSDLLLVGWWSNLPSSVNKYIFNLDKIVLKT